MSEELIEKIITYNYNEYGAEFGDALVDLKHENEWLHHIIKEVREYIQNDIKGNYFKRYDDEVYEMCEELLEILDKVGDEILK